MSGREDSVSRCLPFRVGVSLLLAWTLGACSTGPVRPAPSDADVTVFFVGTSLTSTHALPGTVAQIAAADGSSWRTSSLTAPNHSLEDLWRAGAADAVREAGADVVVLQQGPSSLPENAEHLRRWAIRYAEVIRDSGGRPALLMVWPSRDRWHALDDVRASYAGAAEAVDGLFVPAGSVWGQLLEHDPATPLTEADGFHPAPLGTYAAALTTYGILAAVEPAELPCPALSGVDGDRLAAVCDAVRENLAVDAVSARRR